MSSRVGGGGPSAAPAPLDLLAPGFRFHPTDVELVAYYLKRKVAGRPLRVDAIGELDLYKREPWDLPALAQLRSGDMEWYFFSPLDRKYANCSRTNRATPEGYWKTTGKDRPVHHAGCTVGMKKTLVFHSGRAPRGLRTNWVMHEYRLEPAVDVRQDGYVVCRIFQKRAPGPQNGAQYGAHFVEEEWEVEERERPVEPQDGSSVLPDVGFEDYCQLTDFMEDMDVGNQQEDTALLMMGTAEQNGEAQFEDTLLLEDILNDQNLFIDVDGYINMPTRQEAMHISGNEENTNMGHSDSSPTQSDGFLELNDLKNMENVDGLSIEDLVGCLARTCADQVYPTDENNNVHGGEEFFDIVNENFEQPEVFEVSPELPDGIYLQPNDNLLNPIPSHNIPDHSTEENLDFFDAPSHELGQENFAQMNDIPYTSIANSPGFDMVDELMAFFDATDANLHYAPLNALQHLQCDDFFDHSNLPQEVGSGSPPTSEPSVKALGEGVEMGSSSSIRLLSDDDGSSGKADSVCDALDAPRHDSSDKSFKKRLVNMLGSIPSPPALAAEFPTKAVNQFTSSVTHPASSIHMSPGMIHIRSLTMTGSGKHWSAHKNGSLGFLLSYGMAGSGAVGKSVVFEPAMKMHGGALTVVLRGWFYVFFLSALFLAASFRIGVNIYSR